MYSSTPLTGGPGLNQGTPTGPGAKGHPPPTSMSPGLAGSTPWAAATLPPPVSTSAVSPLLPRPPPPSYRPVSPGKTQPQGLCALQSSIVKVILVTNLYKLTRITLSHMTIHVNNHQCVSTALPRVQTQLPPTVPQPTSQKPLPHSQHTTTPPSRAYQQVYYLPWGGTQQKYLVLNYMCIHETVVVAYALHHSSNLSESLCAMHINMVIQYNSRESLLFVLKT